MRAGVCSRPPGRVPRNPQPQSHRSRHGRTALDPRRLRANIVDHRRPRHSAQPDGLQGWDQQPARRRHRTSPTTSGSRAATGPTGWSTAATSWSAGSGSTSKCGTDRRSTTRSKPSGAQRSEAHHSAREASTMPSISRRRRAGGPVIPPTRTSGWPTRTTGLFLLRRGYSFTDGIDPQTGQLDAGLFFLAYQHDPRKQFIPLQQSLAAPRPQRVHPTRRLVDLSPYHGHRCRPGNGRDFVRLNTESARAGLPLVDQLGGVNLASATQPDRLLL